MPESFTDHLLSGVVIGGGIGLVSNVLGGRWCAHGCSAGKRVRANLHQAAFGVTLLVTKPLDRRLVLARSSHQHGGATRPGGNAGARQLLAN